MSSKQVEKKEISPMTVTGVVAVIGILACTTLGIISYLPEREITQGFRWVFGTFTFTASGVIAVVGVLAILALIGGGYAGFVFGRGNLRLLNVKVVSKEAEALQATRDAELKVTVAPPGHQIVVHQVTGRLNMSHTPLQLAPGKVNGVEPDFTVEEQQRWALHSMAFGNLKTPTQNSPLLSPPVETSLPHRVDLAEYMTTTPMLRNLFLGIGKFANGEVRRVSAPLDRLVHIATAGSSGFGKSTFMLALAYQVINAKERPSPVMLDPQGVTFSVFSGDQRLLYPLASKETDIVTILLALVGELRRREELFSKWRGVSSLRDYNNVVKPEEQLAPIPIFFDEFGLVAGHKDIATQTKQLASAGRKVGMSIIAGSQTWYSDEIASSLKANLSTAVQFYAKSKSQSRVLLGASVATEITRAGQAYAHLPGQPGLIEMQAPDPSNVIDVTPELINPETQPPMPEPVPILIDETAQQVINLKSEGVSNSAIARQVFGGDGGNQLTKVRRILEENQRP